jgi:glycosyltransferase involved in cell wall biosynthesis
MESLANVQRTREMSLRVLVVMPLGVALGGGEEMLRQLLREGRGQGIEWIVVFLRPGPLVDEVASFGIETHVVEAGRFRELGKRVDAVRRIARLARERKVDMVFGWMVAGQATAGPAASIAGLKNAWYQVGTPGPDWLDRFATLWPAAGVIALSKAGVEAQARIWPHRPVRLVHPGASLAAADAAGRLEKGALRSRFGLPVEAVIIGTVGRLQRWKGMHVFLEAFAGIHAGSPETHGVIVGGPHETEPGYGDELRSQAGRLGIAGAVTLAGFQSNAVEWMQAMDVVVHAADREPFGIVVVEAMALGKPVVAGAAGGPSEIITNGMTGLLAPFGDVPGLKTALLRILTDPPFAARIGAAARERAADFSDTAYAAKVISTIREFSAS